MKEIIRKPASDNSKTLSDKELAELKENAAGILADCRKQILTRYPFIGSIMMTMDIIPCRDSRIPTACTTGDKIYFDIGFLASLKPEERIFVLAHEVWHCVMNHLSRQTTREQHLFNVATDIEVNELLKADGLSCPEHACTCKSHNVPNGKSAEEIYEILISRKDQQNDTNGFGNSSRSSSGGTSDNSQSDSSQQSRNNQKNDEDQKNTSGNSEGKLDGQFDKHLTEGQTTDDLAEPENPVEDKYGKVGHDNDLDTSIRPNISEKIREAVVSAAQQMQQRGELPAHIGKIVQDLLKPQISWKEVLSNFVTKSIAAGDSDWSRPNKRFAASGIYLPSRESEACKIAVGLDTSGSCNNDIKLFLSEVNGIVKTFPDYQLHMIQCDAEIGKVDEYNAENPLDLENTEFETTGGGGTRLMPIFEYVTDNQLDVDAVVVFSDCYCEDIPTDACDRPVLWICTNKAEHENINCGEIIPFDKKA